MIGDFDSESEYSPWDDATGEGWKHKGGPVPPDGLGDVLKEMSELEFGAAYRALAQKVVWDFIMSLIQPTANAMDTLLDAIVQLAYKDVMGQYAKAGATSEGDVEALKQAAAQAARNFVELYKDPLLTKQYRMALTESFRKHLKKKKK